MSSDAARRKFLKGVKAAMDAHSQNAHKWDELYSWFSDEFGDDVGELATGKLLTENKQIGNRITKELPETSPAYVVLCALEGVSLEQTRRYLKEANLPNARCALIMQELEPIELQVYEDDSVSKSLANLFPETPPMAVTRSEASAAAGGGQMAAGGGLSNVTIVPIAVDDRIKRMVHLAILSSPAVVLVGPPGTGKTAILREVIDAISQNPGSFGFESQEVLASWFTPEESWTARDLIGGETVDEDGALRFRPGHVLDAIRDGRWLVLDEVNRADMDKIFGGLFTWLSADQEVELGRATTALNAPLVKLGWNDGPDNVVENLEQLEATNPEGDAIRFLAGSEWRLLGTYNALDAQRVFRFGEALGRRFARVPIPAPPPEDFRAVLAPVVGEFPDGVAERLVDAVIGLYAAHYESPATELGPALFVRIPDYVRAGLRLGDSKAAESAESEGAPAEPSTDPESDYVDRLVAEGYLLHVGTWIARLEARDLEELGVRVFSEFKALPKDEWDWLRTLAPTLG